ncbi:hypothetical protein L21SP2_1124 [Salinispira pacifica]|uniref:Uncharacterized protein n=1 Tax=Salinispira pacifica TaxID=1307761 RepID=V5WFF5_9SPIO|nr:hypothetical protein L21SP2_1124 [Salinispira pacifica]
MMITPGLMNRALTELAIDSRARADALQMEDFRRLVGFLLENA